MAVQTKRVYIHFLHKSSANKHAKVSATIIRSPDYQCEQNTLVYTIQ